MSGAEDDVTTDGPTDAQQRRMDESKGLFWRTCDQCAKQGICLVNGEAYICEECQEFHEHALDAAHDAIRETGLVPLLRDHDVDRIAWAAVKAYTEYVNEPSTDCEDICMTECQGPCGVFS